MPLASSAVNHQVIPCRHPAIAKHHRRERDLYVNNTNLSPVISCTMLCIVLHSRVIQTHTHIAHCKTAHS
ncbi:unnamed protein product [Staurois parvus]|uniref:Uncharacterized protein n=1 Tax=Staurois parvus TaxID=386267 RepID=A0ABN9E9G7_9NEOB|nr:unnamed protein product [Staurois parvus]